MAVYKLNVNQAMEVVDCGECGTAFGTTEAFMDRRREDGKTFYCPNGHQRVFRETEVQRLKKELDKEKMKVATAEQEAQYEKTRRESAERDMERAQRKTAAKKGQLTRLQNRIAKGYCPCCKKNFPELYNHLVAEHPEYVEEHPSVMKGIKGLLPANGAER
jgi:flagellar biosynthesis/type III secretory pathway protein FliH